MERIVLGRIIEALKKEGEYLQAFEADDTDAIERFRALGRRAGRELRWKVRTYATDPRRRRDRRVLVCVVVNESSPLRDQLQMIRMRKAVQANRPPESLF